MSSAGKLTPTNTLAVGLIALGALVRISSHLSDFSFFPPNFAPIGGMALFAGAYIAGSRGFFLPLAALLLSDFIIGFYDPIVMIAVYASFAVMTLIGRLLKQHPGIVPTAGAALASSTLFFLITNFAEWLRPESFYAPTLAGLAQAYVAAIPFFRYTIAGDLCFTAFFFISYALARRWVTQPYATKASAL